MGFPHFLSYFHLDNRVKWPRRQTRTTMLRSPATNCSRMLLATPIQVTGLPNPCTDGSYPPGSAAQAPKRGRGRPKGSKNKKAGSSTAADESAVAPVKKKRGRPPKVRRTLSQSTPTDPQSLGEARRFRGAPSKASARTPAQKSTTTGRGGRVCVGTAQEKAWSSAKGQAGDNNVIIFLCCFSYDRHDLDILYPYRTTCAWTVLGLNNPATLLIYVVHLHILSTRTDVICAASRCVSVRWEDAEGLYWLFL